MFFYLKIHPSAEAAYRQTIVSFADGYLGIRNYPRSRRPALRTREVGAQALRAQAASTAVRKPAYTMALPFEHLLASADDRKEAKAWLRKPAVSLTIHPFIWDSGGCCPLCWFGIPLAVIVCCVHLADTVR